MPDIVLNIEKGSPFAGGQSVTLLGRDSFLLGRAAGDTEPDISFASLCVSRKHAMITYQDRVFYITDLASKHGTTINGRSLEGNRQYALRNGDRIGLANDTAVIYFHDPNETNSDETVDFNSVQPRESPALGGIEIHPERREVITDSRILNLVGKDIDLVMLLYANLNKAVSFNEIKTAIWPERAVSLPDDVPDVGNDEISVLVYRLRRKLGRYSDCIVSVPRYGYMLDIK